MKICFPFIILISHHHVIYLGNLVWEVDDKYHKYVQVTSGRVRI